MRFLPALLSLLLLAAPVWAQPGSWQELPNTKYTQSPAICGNAGALPAPDCVPTTFGGANAVDAWVDGDYAPLLRKFIIPRGGGHADGKGNQVIAFDLVSGQWVLLTPPSLKVPPITETNIEPRAVYKLDWTPSSVHSYGSLAWMEWLGKMWSAGGIYYSQGGESVPPRTWWWDPAHAETPTSAWSERYTKPDWSWSPQCGYGTYAVANPLRRRVLVRCSGGMYVYVPALADDTLVDTGPKLRWRQDSATQQWNSYTDSTAQNPYKKLYSQASLGSSARALDEATDLVYSISAQSGGGIAVQRGNATPGLLEAAAREITLLTSGGFTPGTGMPLIFDAGRLVTLGPAPVTGKVALWTLNPTNCGTGTLPPCLWVQQISPSGIYSEARDTAHGTWRKFFRHGCDYYHIAGGAKNVWKITPPWRTDTCPPPTASLTVAAAGTGIGTVTGGGVYVVDSPVTVTATPATGSTLTGMIPTLCNEKPTFPMPAAGLACTATFALNPPPPPPPLPGTSPLVGLQPRVFKPFPSGLVGSQTKHTRIAHADGLMVLAGGDGTGPHSSASFTGQQVFSIDLAKTDQWTMRHPFCAPPGGIMPPRPDDVTWAYDAKRKQMVMMPAYYGLTASGCPGIIDEPVRMGWAFDLLSNLWKRGGWPMPPNISKPLADGTWTFGWGGDLHNHFGVLNPKDDSVYRFHGNCGAQRIPLDGSMGECTKLTFPTPITNNPWNLSNDQMALDERDQMIYAIARYQRALIKWSIADKKVVEVIPMPATWYQPDGVYETHVAFDSKNRVLMHPNTGGYGGLGPGGVPAKIGFYTVDTKTWEWEDAPVGVTGNTLGYDATNNVFLWLGRTATKQFWLYRYK